MMKRNSGRIRWVETSLVVLAACLAVVGSGGEKEPVLEPRCDLPDGTRDLGVDGILLPARWCSMVGLIEDEQRTAAESAEPIQQRAGVALVDEKSL